MGVRDLLFIGVVAGGAATLGSGLLRPKTLPVPATTRRAPAPAAGDDLRPAVDDLDAAFRARWAEAGHVPTPRAEELAVMRRLALALTGTAPSLEEIRRFESRPADRRVEAYLEDLLAD